MSDEARPRCGSGFTLNRPHPSHVPMVNRVAMGRALPQSPPKFGTTMRCSCGWMPETVGGNAGMYGGMISADAPSQGGRTVASHLYRRHLTAEGVT